MFVTVGSDHHPFDRLVGWVDSWARDRGANVFVQRGTARAPLHCPSVDFMPHDELQRKMSDATVVVVQGGPMSVVESRACGRFPIAVPRLAALGEVVDDHQVDFVEQLAGLGQLRPATDEASLRLALDEILAEPGRFIVDPQDSGADQAIHNASRELRAVMGSVAYPTVCYIGGYGRSGSTLLERLVSHVGEVQPLGEVLYLWKHGAPAGERCGCGLLFMDCSFWTKVGDHAYGGWEGLPGDMVAALRERVLRMKYLPGLVTGLSPSGRRLSRDRLARLAEQLYAAAAEVSGRQVLVDSSKHPSYAYLLRRSRIDLRAVLIVRDPRGVAHSWSKTMQRPEVMSATTYMPRYSVAASAARWTAYNFTFSLLGRLGVPLLVVRYEDLVADPSQTVADVLRFLDVEGAPGELGQPVIDLTPSHSAAGNPMRFTSGPISLVADDAWRREMKPWRQRLVTALTLVSRRRYGYR